MVRVAGVRFKTAGKVYYFDPDILDVKAGDDVIVETARGMEYGTVTMDVQEVEDHEIVDPDSPFIVAVELVDFRGGVFHIKGTQKADGAGKL